MKRIAAAVLAFVMMTVSACGGPASSAEPASSAAPAESSAAESAAPAESSAAESPAAETDEAAEDLITVMVNMDGLGEIASTDDGTEPAFDEEYPMNSFFYNTPKGTVISCISSPMTRAMAATVSVFTLVR